ncbi:MAG: DHH family phosphoesterase [Chloroflexi bacterium]|nr:DHH family phosphoesterase [Chloroflexota bacterium]MBL6965730.1 DHH family phosphoesterase [Anaerolineales bacterium]
MTKEHLDRLQDTLSGQTRVLILPHNDPDPDAIAAAVGLRYLLVEKFAIEARIAYHGIIGRAENKALVRYLKNPSHKLNSSELGKGIPIALVDTQPGAGNNPLPANITPIIVIDHHTWREASALSPFVDVRTEIGASATIITSYLQAADLDPPPFLATALFYGIKTDTMSLGRNASPDDVEAYFYLQPKIDVNALIEIERAQVPATYFKNLARFLQATRIYDDNLLITNLGMLDYPDLGAEIADLLLRLQGARWVICIGEYNHELILSVRSRSVRIGAGKLAQKIVGNLGTAGGHGTMAGGHVPLRDNDPEQVRAQLVETALRYIKGDANLAGAPLAE